MDLRIDRGDSSITAQDLDITVIVDLEDMSDVIEAIEQWWLIYSTFLPIPTMWIDRE